MFWLLVWFACLLIDFSLLRLSYILVSLIFHIVLPIFTILIKHASSLYWNSFYPNFNQVIIILLRHLSREIFLRSYHGTTILSWFPLCSSSGHHTSSTASWWNGSNCLLSFSVNTTRAISRSEGKTLKFHINFG